MRKYSEREWWERVGIGQSQWRGGVTGIMISYTDKATKYFMWKCENVIDFINKYSALIIFINLKVLHNNSWRSEPYVKLGYNY